MKIEKPQVDKMLTLSTGHLCGKTIQLLSQLAENEDSYGSCPISLPVYKKSGYGWFIYPNDEPELLPDDLRAVLDYAKRHEFTVICLDCDGPYISLAE